MKLSDIRNLNDKDLNTLLINISNNNGRVCCKCGNIVYKNDRITIMKNEGVATKKLCCICKECYPELLDYLGVNDCK